LIDERTWLDAASDDYAHDVGDGSCMRHRKKREREAADRRLREDRRLGTS